jgi:hypothetical protein
VRLAVSYDRIHQAGAEVAAVSVDDEVRQAGMVQRWGLVKTNMVADPGGERYLQPLGLFDPEERGGIALPAILLIDPAGQEVYRYEGRDFADRTSDDDLLAALDGLDLEPIEPEPVTTTIEVPPDLSGFFRPSDLGAYYRGNMFGALALERRIDHEESKAMARQHRRMAKATLDAWKEHRSR